VDINIDHAKVELDNPVFDNLAQVSEIDGSRTFFNREYGWEYEVIVHLFKYGNEAARLAKYNTLNDNLYDLVTLYRHRDNEPIKDSLGNEVPFLFSEIEPFYINSIPNGLNEPGDALILKFISTKNLRLQQSAAPPIVSGGIITEVTEDTIITETGGLEIITE
jgi:hypothetical protein